MSLNLTREGIIEEHRKMWRWIAENGWEMHEKKDPFCILNIKSKYLNKYFPNESIKNNCFCCEYTTQFNNLDNVKCRYCPLKWDIISFPQFCVLSSNSPYYSLSEIMFFNNGTKEEFRRLALEIANLPEREV